MSTTLIILSDNLFAIAANARYILNKMSSNQVMASRPERTLVSGMNLQRIGDGNEFRQFCIDLQSMSGSFPGLEVRRQALNRRPASVRLINGGEVRRNQAALGHLSISETKLRLFKEIPSLAKPLAVSMIGAYQTNVTSDKETYFMLACRDEEMERLSYERCEIQRVLGTIAAEGAPLQWSEKPCDLTVAYMSEGNGLEVRKTVLDQIKAWLPVQVELMPVL